jgi:hypothetical protein
MIEDEGCSVWKEEEHKQPGGHGEEGLYHWRVDRARYRTVHPQFW